MGEFTVEDVVALVDGIAPFAGAAPWDRVGLQLGDVGASVEGVHVALDPTLAAISATRARGADVLLCHHPLIMEPLSGVLADEAVGARVMHAVREGVAVVVAHTNADVVWELSSAPVAGALGVESPRLLLEAEAGGELKLVVFVPPAAVDQVAGAMAEAGAGLIGDYAECAFRTAGTGTFRPLEGATPTVGQVGRREEVEEVRLEMVVAGSRLRGVLAAMLEAHPYEEVAHDVYRLESAGRGGYGWVGELPERLPVEELAARAGDLLGVRPTVLGRTNSPVGEDVSRVAFMPGSATGAAKAALGHRADVLVCGELKYHDALDARERGLDVLVVGHDASERPLVEALASALRRAVEDRGLACMVSEEGRPGSCQPGRREGHVT